MKCFLHPENNAVGLCRCCMRNLCQDETHIDDNLTGLFCSEKCANFISEQQRIHECAKKIYSIGKNKTKLSFPVLMITIIGVLFILFGLVFYKTSIPELSLFLLFFGLPTVIFGIAELIRRKRLKLNL
ncbi:MAG: hypothetical protein RLZ12_737 [Bacillota bacterium]|jgi:hypothetical protein